MILLLTVTCISEATLTHLFLKSDLILGCYGGDVCVSNSTRWWRGFPTRERDQSPRSPNNHAVRFQERTVSFSVTVLSSHRSAPYRCCHKIYYLFSLFIFVSSIFSYILICNIDNCTFYSAFVVCVISENVYFKGSIMKKLAFCVIWLSWI